MTNKDPTMFAEQFLKELAEKEGVPPPKFKWAFMSWTAGYYAQSKTIALHPERKRFFHLNPELVENLTKFSLAHEFKHYLLDLQSVYLPLYRLEQLCDKYAEEVTGKTLKQHKEEHKEFGRLIRVELRPISSLKYLKKRKKE